MTGLISTKITTLFLPLNRNVREAVSCKKNLFFASQNTKLNNIIFRCDFGRKLFILSSFLVSLFTALENFQFLSEIIILIIT